MNKSKQEILTEKLKEFGLNFESKLYRYTSEKYMINSGDVTFIKAKDENLDLVVDHYEDVGHTFISKEFGKGLSFLSKPEPEYEKDGRKCVEIKLNEVFGQGGLIYEIISLPAYLKGYFVTLPSGAIKITKTN